MLWSLLTFGSLTFWLLSLGLCGVVVAAVENEKGLMATISFLIYLAILQLFSDFNVLNWLSVHLYWVLLAALLYFVVGSIWGIFKWSLFVSKKASEHEEKYREVRMNFIRSKMTECPGSKWISQITTPITLETPIPETLKIQWQQYINTDTWLFKDCSPAISPKEHKSTILTWMSFWPASLSWTLINDPIRAAFRHIYAFISGTLENIARKAFADLKQLHQQDLEQQVPPKN